MSRILDRFPEPAPRKRTLPKYDWGKWLDGRVHALTREEYGDPYTFRNAAHAAANRKGMRIRTTMIGDELVIEATPPAIVLRRPKGHSASVA